MLCSSTSKIGTLLGRLFGQVCFGSCEPDCRSRKFDKRGCITWNGECRKKNLVYPSQRAHVDNINSINQRIHKLGRVEFFQIKSIAMKFTLPPKIEAGKVPFFQDSQVCRIALKNITDLTFTEVRASNPNDLLMLPKQTRPFKDLKNYACLFNTAQTIVDINDLTDRLAMPSSFANLLVDIGVSKDTKVYLTGKFPDMSMRVTTAERTEKARPIFQARARMLKEAKKEGRVKRQNDTSSSGQAANGGGTNAGGADAGYANR